MNTIESPIGWTVDVVQPKQRHVIENRKLKRLQHVHTIVMTGAGFAGCVTALFLQLFLHPVSASAIGIFVGSFFLVGMGLTIGFHRHFTHRSYNAPTWLRVTLGILGCMAGQGPIIFWTALHRMHHALADREGDPHSPNLHGSTFGERMRGLFHAYIGWTVTHDVPNANFYARDILSDKPIMWVNRNYYLWVVLGLALPAGVGWLLTGSAYGALEGFLWGGLIRMFALHNVIWWITSFAHVIGERDYAAPDRSTNNVWLAIPTLGESWHNTHHAFPRAAILSLDWWQIDISGGVLTILERLGAVTDVNRISPEERERRRN